MDDGKRPHIGWWNSYWCLVCGSLISVIAIAVARFIFGEEAARGEIVAQIRAAGP